jgi:hypothetical protein
MDMKLMENMVETKMGVFAFSRKQKESRDFRETEKVE